MLNAALKFGKNEDIGLYLTDADVNKKLKYILHNQITFFYNN